MNSHFGKHCLCVAPAEDATMEEIIEYALLHMKVEPIEPSDLRDDDEEDETMDVE